MLEQSRYSNEYKVSQYDREVAIDMFEGGLQLRADLSPPLGLRLVCRCRPHEEPASGTGSSADERAQAGQNGKGATNR